MDPIIPIRIDSNWKSGNNQGAGPSSMTDFHISGGQFFKDLTLVDA